MACVSLLKQGNDEEGFQELFHPFVLPPNATLIPCPYCGCQAQLFGFTTALELQMVVCCKNEGEEAKGIEPCPLSLPPKYYYFDQEMDAVNFWNQYPEQLRETARNYE
ncbi:MAG: hypothetical protein DHS20C12_11670 [Pseudohongiella sp.]|nr:MAG: hypothetical protein DHS20C12_11670 [Pseudohongiella sp.]